MDNMEELKTENFKDRFNRYRQTHQPLTLSEDFESNVFAKIKRKKQQRKIATAAAAGVFLAAFLMTGQLFFFKSGPDRDRTKMLSKPQSSTITEEVPVLEDVVFASSDSQTSYAIEQVSYSDDDNTI